MGTLSDRLRASVRFDAVNGDAHERAVCVRQMIEAANTLDRHTYALRAIAAMHVDDSTEHRQLSALCIATARTALGL